MIANLKIQCNDNNGKIGTFLYDNKTGVQITPTFKDFFDLYGYMQNHFPDRESINYMQYRLITISK